MDNASMGCYQFSKASNSYVWHAEQDEIMEDVAELEGIVNRVAKLCGHSSAPKLIKLDFREAILLRSYWANNTPNAGHDQEEDERLDRVYKKCGGAPHPLKYEVQVTNEGDGVARYFVPPILCNVQNLGISAQSMPHLEKPLADDSNTLCCEESDSEAASVDVATRASPKGTLPSSQSSSTAKTMNTPVDFDEDVPELDFDEDVPELSEGEFVQVEPRLPDDASAGNGDRQSQVAWATRVEHLYSINLARDGYAKTIGKIILWFFSIVTLLGLIPLGIWLEPRIRDWCHSRRAVAV